MRILVPTCASYYRLLPGFAHQFNKYWDDSQEVFICGHEPLNVRLPDNFVFISVTPVSYPAVKWTNGVIRALQIFRDNYIVMMLEDYWLREKVNTTWINDLETWMEQHQDVLRMDLTADRLGSGCGYNVGKISDLEIIETPYTCAYQISLQAAMWNRRGLLNMLPNYLSPWEVETILQYTISKTWKIQGTRQVPVRYVNAWGMGWNGPGPNVSGLKEDDIKELRTEGII